VGGRRVFRLYVVIYISAYFSDPSGSQQGFGSNDLLRTLRGWSPTALKWPPGARFRPKEEQNFVGPKSCTFLHLILETHSSCVKILQAPLIRIGTQHVQEANSLIWKVGTSSNLNPGRQEQIGCKTNFAMNKLILVISLSITAACLLWATGCSTHGGTYTRPHDPQFNTARDQ
jgi:hypothetical protein